MVLDSAVVLALTREVVEGLGLRVGLASELVDLACDVMDGDFDLLAFANLEAMGLEVTWTSLCGSNVSVGTAGAEKDAICSTEAAVRLLAKAVESESSC